MLKARYALGLALLMAASLYLLPALQAAGNPLPDSPEVTELLKQAKNQANTLRKDAEEMKDFGATKLAWESHAVQINIIKTHVNKLGKIVQQLSERHQFASPWQQTAIDRITPLASELGSNVEKTIQYMNKNKGNLYSGMSHGSYQEYLTANADVAASLSSLISDYVSYGKNKAAYDRLGSELEVSSR